MLLKEPLLMFSSIRMPPGTDKSLNLKCGHVESKLWNGVIFLVIKCEDCLVGGCWKDSWNPFVKLSCQNKGAAELHQPPAEPGHHGLGLLYAAKGSTSTHSPRLPCFHCVGRSIYPPPSCRRSCPTHLGQGMPPHGRRSTCCWVGESSWTVAWMWSTWQFQVRFDLCYPTLLKNILPADSDGVAKVDGIHETRTCSWGHLRPPEQGQAVLRDVQVQVRQAGLHLCHPTPGIVW